MRERPLSPSGKVLKAVGVALLIVGGAIYGLLGPLDENPIAAFGVFVMLGGVLLHFRGRQQAAKFVANSPTSPLRTTKAGVLYLRAFRADASTFGRILASGLSSEEEQLARALRPFGDLIAVGRPGELLPLPGAVRMYASDAEWKGIVLDRMRAAALVIVRAGAGPGLLWEIEQVRSIRAPETVLILVSNLPAEGY